ncbi:glycosyltransferase [Streptomyces yaizuensis]|uniref:Glycosyltransferase n=1 Tax=Streptomyces yaizuensis TaxID=2989713 RepID=A0ABQ5P2W3_9ACTN|nr:glycosyltransferase [Streptomyces sp. YSPA8]GLF96931.1 glycosyltransferase [Streptomyces sp. YSPA8]
MRVAVMTAGSRGDVAPYTGLGHGLARAGHRVTLVTHARFAPLARAAGLGFHPLPVDPRTELESPAGLGLHRSSSGAGKLARLVTMARRHAGRFTADLVAAARESDVVLVSASLAPLGHAVAEALRLPSLGVFLQPVAATTEFAPPVTGTRSWGPHVNRLAGRAVNAAMDVVFADAVRALRHRLGLPPARMGALRRARERERLPVLHGYSELVVPRPRDWRPELSVVGYWWPHEQPERRLPRPLEDFLAAGPPPVVVGLGSATVPDAERVSATVVRALRTAGLRGVIQSGWSGLRADGDDLLTVGELPHSALFPRAAAVVHAAGAGTTAAGLRAGVPAVPVPLQFDQPFWGERLVRLGVAPRSVPLRRLTAPALAAALTRATSDPGYRERATDLAGRLTDEDGVAPVLAALERIAGHGPGLGSGPG